MKIYPSFSQAPLSLLTPREHGAQQQAQPAQEQERSTKQQADLAKLRTRDREVGLFFR